MDMVTEHSLGNLAGVGRGVLEETEKIERVLGWIGSNTDICSIRAGTENPKYR